MLVLPVTIHLALPIEAALVVVLSNGLCMAGLLRSSTSPSWCRGSFPWSCCSADHGDSPVAVRMVIDVLFVQVVQFHRCWCGGDSCVSTVSSRWDVVDIPVVAQRLVFMVLTVQSDHRASPIAVSLTRCSTSRLCRSSRFGCSWRGDSRDPTVAARLSAWTLSFTCPSF